nr:Rab family GTPase [Candidatus Sigynarchaeota archaeon]
MAENYDYNWKIVVGGPSGVGKTCFLHRYIFREFVKDTKPTIGCQFHTQVLKRNKKKIKMDLWDLGGHFKEAKQHSCVTPPFNAAFLLFDLSDKQTLENLRKEWISQIKEGSPATMPIVLVGTKMDIVNKEQLAKMETMAQAFVKENKLMAFKATSSKLGVKVDETITDMVNMLV